MFTYKPIPEEHVRQRSVNRRIALYNTKTGDIESVYSNCRSIRSNPIVKCMSFKTMRIHCDNHITKDGYIFWWADEYENEYEVLLPGAMVELT